jgi:hypothetical protein
MGCVLNLYSPDDSKSLLEFFSHFESLFKISLIRECGTYMLVQLSPCYIINIGYNSHHLIHNIEVVMVRD